MKRVLIICTNPPWPPDSGASLRSLGWLRIVSKMFKVGVVSLTNGKEQENSASELRAYCDFVRLVRHPRTTPCRFRDLLRTILNDTPYIVQAAHSNSMVKAVTETIEQWQPDIVQAEWIGAAPYLGEARKRGLPTIYSAHNVESQVVDMGKKRWLQCIPPFSPDTMCSAETSYARDAELVVTVTEEEKKWFQQVNKRVICVPNSIHPDEYSFHLPSRRAEATVVFIGHLHYPPNIEAAEELITRIFPLIQKQIPKVRCVIAGRQPSSSLRRLAGKNPYIQILGDVDDMSTVWSQASILICPLRSGGGSRLKLLEAAACGVPIIATPFSASGLALVPERDYIAVSGIVEFAETSVAMLRDAGRRDSIARQARKTVRQHHDWELFQKKLQQLYEDIACHHRKK